MDKPNKKLPPENILQTTEDNKTLQTKSENRINVDSSLLENKLPLPPTRVPSLQEDINYNNISSTYVDMTRTQGNSNLQISASSTQQISSYVDMKQINNKKLSTSDILNPLYSANDSNFNTKSETKTRDTNSLYGYVDMTFNKGNNTITKKLTDQSIINSSDIGDDKPPPLPIKTKIGSHLRLNINKNQFENSSNEKSSDITTLYEVLDLESKIEPPKNKVEQKLIPAESPMSSRSKFNLHREDISRFKTALIDPQITQTLLRSMSQEENNAKKKINPIKKVLGFQKINKENSFICEMFNNQLRDSEVLILKPSKYAGMLELIPNNKDNDETRVVITDGCITWHLQKSEKNIKIEHIISIEAIDAKSGEVAIFEIIWWEKQGGTRVQKFAARNIEERDKWMQNILESVTCIFTNDLTSQFIRTGWLHIKEGTGGTWSACRLLLKDRELFYCVNPGKIHVSDLRMARSIAEYKITGLDGNSDEETVILLELGSRVFYLRALNEQDLSCWNKCIRSAALNNGQRLDQQQLTRDLVPVIVDKCINFVATHGSCSEGIYRRIESGTATQELLSEFKNNAWVIQLSKQSYSEHVVAATLRLFFAELPEPLIPANLASYFRTIAMEEDDIDSKVARYHALINELPQVSLVTTTRLFGHLHLLHLQSNKNKMDARNLANIWSANIIRTHLEASLNSHQQVIEDLISLFPRIFDASEEDLQRELKIQNKLEMFQNGNEIPNSPTSDLLLVWISMGGYYSLKYEKVYIGSATTAGDVVRQLGMSEDYMLQEYILGGSLARPLIKSKKVRQILLRWSEWNLEDRKDNRLVMAPSLFYKDIIQLKTPRQHVCGDLKFGDTSKKDFKKYYFEIYHGILSCYKDAKKNEKLKEWKIEDIVWYLGFEPNRNPNTKWSITFIEKDKIPKRSKERVHFGYTLGGTSKETLIQWSYAFLHTVYIKQISEAISSKANK